MKKTIGIIGGGNMGTAIISRICKKYSVLVCEKDKTKCQTLKRKYHVVIADLEVLTQKADIIILAVKPQNFEDILKEINSRVTDRQLIISIAAGITTRYIEQRLDGRTRVIRTMPNLPAQVGEGITGICSGRYASRSDLKIAQIIFEQIGETLITQEKWMDTITAVSGSGPAYVFLFIELMQKAAKSLGLTTAMSRALVRETLEGSLRLLDELDEDPETLRAQVTSKGGTTQAAMDVFERYKTENIFKQAFKAAQKRARELSK